MESPPLQLFSAEMNHLRASLEPQPGTSHAS